MFNFFLNNIFLTMVIYLSILMLISTIAMYNMEVKQTNNTIHFYMKKENLI